jgi:hypothetical protein
VRPAAVAGERDQQPLGGDLLAAAEAEAGEPDRTLDDAETGSTVCWRFLQRALPSSLSSAWPGWFAVVKVSQSSWLVGAIIPGVERRPAKKLEAGEGQLLALLHRWRDEAAKAGRTIERIAVAPCSGQGQAMRRVATGFGWRAGCRPAVSRRV